MSTEAKPPAVQFTPALFKRMSKESRFRLSAAMNDVIAHHRPGEDAPYDKNWATYWAREFLRALDETEVRETAPLSPMICGCAQGKHEEKRNPDTTMVRDNLGDICRLGWKL